MPSRAERQQQYKARVPPADPGANPQPPTVPRRVKTYGTYKGRSPGSMEEAIVRSNRALELRMAGATWQQVADQMGYKQKSSAQQAVRRAIERETERVADVRESYRTMQLLRIERSIRAIWPQVLQGDLFAIDRELKLMERQAKLLGLDAPTTITITDDTKSELTQLITDLEQVLIPGEVVANVYPTGGDTPARRDQAALESRPGRRAGGGAPQDRDRRADEEGDEGSLEPLSLADSALLGPDDGDVDDARRTRNRQDGGG